MAPHILNACLIKYYIVQSTFKSTLYYMFKYQVYNYIQNWLLAQGVNSVHVCFCIFIFLSTEQLTRLRNRSIQSSACWQPLVYGERLYECRGRHRIVLRDGDCLHVPGWSRSGVIVTNCHLLYTTQARDVDLFIGRPVIVTSSIVTTAE